MDFHAKNDTFICESLRSKNFIKCSYLLIGDGSKKYCHRDLNIALMIFDLSNIDKCSDIKKAELYFYPNYKECNKDDSFFLLEIYKIINPYNFCTVTWQTSPEITSTGCGECIDLNKFNNYVKIDITSLGKLWIRGDVPNYGLALVGKANSGVISINSSKGYNSPFLRIEYDNKMKNKNFLRRHEEYNYPKMRKEDGKIKGLINSNEFACVNSLAQFVTESCCTIKNRDFIPFNKVFNIGKNILHSNGNTHVMLASNHKYLVSWNILLLPKKDKFSIGVGLIFCGENISQSNTFKSFTNNIGQVSLTNSMVINSKSRLSSIRLMYFSNTGTEDEIIAAQMSVIEIN